MPELRSSQAVYEEVLDDAVGEQTRWLDIGCGYQVLPAWRDVQERELVSRAALVVGVDADAGSLRRHRSIGNLTLASIGKLPFAASCFDLVTANMVVEHLAEPAAQLGEIHRVLRPGGRFVFHTPNADGYTTRIARLLPERVKAPLARLLEGRKSDEVFPTHYRANTANAIVQLAAETGFDVEDLNHVATGAQFAVILPLAIMELAWIRLLMNARAARWRQTLIAILRRRD